MHILFSFVLDHPWIKEDGEAPDTPLDNAVLNRLKQFKAMNQFKKVALRVIIIISKFFNQKLSRKTLRVPCHNF